jgi:hypothetical protein
VVRALLHHSPLLGTGFLGKARSGYLPVMLVYQALSGLSKGSLRVRRDLPGIQGKRQSSHPTPCRLPSPSMMQRSTDLRRIRS